MKPRFLLVIDADTNAECLLSLHRVISVRPTVDNRFRHAVPKILYDQANGPVGIIIVDADFDALLKALPEGITIEIEPSKRRE